MEKKTYVMPHIKALVIDGDDMMQQVSGVDKTKITPTDGGTAPEMGIEKGRDDGSGDPGAKGTSFGGLWD